MSIVDSSDDEITGKTLDGIVTSWNPAATRMYGYSAEEMLGRRIADITPADQLDEHAAVTARVARGKRVPACDVVAEPGFVRSAAAREAGLRSAVVVPLGIGHEVVGVLSFLSREQRPREAEVLATLAGVGGQVAQFLERRRAEETLRRQAVLLELAPAAVIVRDAQRRILYWNPAAEALYGWTASEARGRLSHDLLATRFSVSLAQHEATLERAAVWEGELVRRRKDGQEVVVASRWLVLNDARGEKQTVEVSTDISERKRLYESEKAARAAAEAAIRARDEFVAVVSHDLRNPLTAVKAHIQMLRRRAARGEMPNPEQLLERLDTIQRSVTALSGQIDELHDATRLQAGQMLDLMPQPTDIVALARECVESQRHTSEAHQLRFETRVHELIGTWDPARLERVLANLLSNAIKYSPAGGEVVVEVTSEGRWAVVSVTDNGLGVPAADLPHIFERFRRASNVGGQIAGSGLGLAGARDIVEQHGGAIEVRTEEGRGSTFVVRLPLGTGR